MSPLQRFGAIFLAGVLVGFACSPVYAFRCTAARANGATALVCR